MQMLKKCNFYIENLQDSGKSRNIAPDFRENI